MFNLASVDPLQHPVENNVPALVPLSRTCLNKEKSSIKLRKIGQH